MKPANLLYILSDEHNRDSLGCYGHPLVKTPHLDALAAGGVRFDSAYTNCPICVPARASLATGQYVHQIGYWDNAFPYEGRVKGWGHRLIELGHRVDSIGKLHYRSESDDDGFSNKYIPLNVVDGVGDVMGSIRDELPLRNGAREGVLEAGPGESTYLDYDAQIAERSLQWLKEAGQRRKEGVEEKPWVLFVSFVCPHPPFIAPQEFYDLYPLEDIPIPVQNQLDEQPQHPALANIRRSMQYDTPFDPEQIRRVTAAYYGACSYLDFQIGRVLESLETEGLADQTRILYTSDHGESMGRRGLWGKFTMYEESAAVPLILAGPDLPKGESTDDPVTLVDCYQTIMESVGVELSEQEKELPGDSLWPIAKGQPLARSAFSEYHAVASKGGYYMLRRGRMKLVYYIGYPPQLFDLEADSQEENDLADQDEYQQLLADLEKELREILDPEATDRQAKSDQETLIERYGGREAVLARGAFVNSPAPGEKPKFVEGKP